MSTQPTSPASPSTRTTPTPTTKASSASCHRVEERVYREKVVWNSNGKEYSRTRVPLGPTLEREWTPEESIWPARDPIHQDRAEIGYWKRLVAAVMGR